MHEVGSPPGWAVGLPPGQWAFPQAATVLHGALVPHVGIHSFNKHLPRTTEHQALCWALTLPSWSSDLCSSTPILSRPGAEFQLLSFWTPCTAEGVRAIILWASQRVITRELVTIANSWTLPN